MRTGPLVRAYRRGERDERERIRLGLEAIPLDRLLPLRVLRQIHKLIGDGEREDTPECDRTKGSQP